MASPNNTALFFSTIITTTIPNTSSLYYTLHVYTREMNNDLMTLCYNSNIIGSPWPCVRYRPTLKDLVVLYFSFSKSMFMSIVATYILCGGLFRSQLAQRQPDMLTTLLGIGTGTIVCGNKSATLCTVRDVIVSTSGARFDPKIHCRYHTIPITKASM